MYASITCCPRLGCEYHWLPVPVPGETPDEPGWSPDEAQMNLDGLAGLAGPGGEGDFLHTSLVILTCWSRGRRLKRSILCPNLYFYNV